MIFVAQSRFRTFGPQPPNQLHRCDLWQSQPTSARVARRHYLFEQSARIGRQVVERTTCHSLQLAHGLVGRIGHAEERLEVRFREPLLQHGENEGARVDPQHLGHIQRPLHRDTDAPQRHVAEHHRRLIP